MATSSGQAQIRSSAAVASAAADSVAFAIAGWRPAGLAEAAQVFAREAVAAAGLRTPARARALLFAAGKLAVFGESVGLEPRAGVLLHPSVIERFIVAGERELSPATRRTLRTNLRALARASEEHPHPAPVRLARERAKAPYSEAEIAGYLALAAALSTRARRMRATALICAGAGAGLVGADLRHLRGEDVIERSGGLMVVVAGRRARVVPVLSRFHEPLAAAAALAGERYLVGGSDPARKNLTDALSRSLSGDVALPRLEGGRLRATWLSSCARLIGLKAFMDAAGVRCSQRLGDLVAELPEISEHDTMRLLGGSR